MAYINGKEVLFAPQINIGGEGGSSTGGECSGNHIIEVNELPTDNIDENAIYLFASFTDFIYATQYGATSMGEMASGLYYVKTKPTQDIKISGNEALYVYYVEDENNIFCYGDMQENGTNIWVSVSQMFNTEFKGLVTNVDEATEEGLYGVGGSSYHKYIGGNWEEMIYEKDIPIPTTEEITVTPTKETQEITPTNADYISKATVNPIPDEYIIPEGEYVALANQTYYDCTKYAKFSVKVREPYEISTEADMNFLLNDANSRAGDVYKYTGETTNTYENGALYILEEVI